RSTDEGGSGLGLAIARWIVELHGGTIRAEQVDPHGCRMVVKLPLSR
ncbi:MAG: HAMP domain-containing histidine kinase, partial [Acidimicrobiales bacterium]|nr:HAMP domain-containing histidine kinase [Acidimicrobiales bacterium]